MISFNQEVQPVVQKLRRQPYHLRDAIRKELHRLGSEDIIENVNKHQSLMLIYIFNNVL